MTRINTNVASLRGLRSLNKANGLLDTSLQRLSTGLKINSGKDNPSGLIASETLRSQVSAIEQSIKNSSRANNVIGTADAALGEVSNLLNQVRGLVQESLNSGALSSSEVEANQLQVDAALDAINRISANTVFAGDKLIDGSKSFTTQLTSADSAKINDFQINQALFGSSNTVEIEAEITQAAEKGQLNFSEAALTSATTVEVAGAGGSQVLFLGASSTRADIRDAINGLQDVTGVAASLDAGAEYTLGASQATGSFATDEVIGVEDTITISTGASTSLTFTNVSTGADPVTVNFTTGGAAATAVATATGRTITVVLSDSAGGNTSAAINAALQGTTAATNLITSSVAGVATTAVSTGADTATAGGVDAVAAGFLTVSDARNSASGGAANSLGGEVFVEFGDFATGTTAAALGVTAIENAETGALTLRVQLAKTGSAVTSTIDDVTTLLNGTSTVSVDGASVAVNTLVSAANDGGTSVNSVVSSSLSQIQLTGGSDGNNNDLTFYDTRAFGTDGQAQIVFTTAATSTTALGVAVSAGSGDDQVVTFTLAVDEFGEVQTTAADLKNLLETGSDAGSVAARDLVSLDIEGDGSNTLENLTTGSQTAVDVGSRVLQIQSSEFGEDQFVQLNVLSGSLSTTLSDNATAAGRDEGQDIVAVINGQQASSSGLRASIRTATLDAQITFSADTGVNVAGTRTAVTVTGGGALFQIGQEVSAAGQIGLGIEAVNTARLGGVSGKLYELGSGGGKSLLDISPDVPGADLVNIVEEAINRVATLRGRLGAVQANVIDTNIATLGVALENISEARSVITDTDFAVTTAELTKAQILNQAGISVLSIANQNPSQVLSLLG